MTATLASIPASPSTLLQLYQNANRLPIGKWLFSQALCLKAPYFSSIAPRVVELRPGLAVWKVKKRRAVQNHIGTVHALAMGNLAELCAGTAIDASLPKHLRWIPKGMNIEYLKKATTDLVGSCEINDIDQLQAGEKILEVKITNLQGEMVVRALITMWLTEKK
ncbi:MAG: DUF4442 domain-containing protein [Hahellaceae bacterium]|nr:DUF4442 domain-containing protein [Hahellaceae bacterium]MCP5168176.1 DUF4442 domain-containing protein [Hahellaceae bacterium]